MTWQLHIKGERRRRAGENTPGSVPSRLIPYSLSFPSPLPPPSSFFFPFSLSYSPPPLSLSIFSLKYLGMYSGVSQSGPVPRERRERKIETDWLASFLLLLVLYLYLYIYSVPTYLPTS